MNSQCSLDAGVTFLSHALIFFERALTLLMSACFLPFPVLVCCLSIHLPPSHPLPVEEALGEAVGSEGELWSLSMARSPYRLPRRARQEGRQIISISNPSLSTNFSCVTPRGMGREAERMSLLPSVSSAPRNGSASLHTRCRF